MNLKRLFLLGTLGTFCFLTSAQAYETSVFQKPVYIGARACAKCHSGKSMGHQFSRWLISKHAGSWASLAKPESKIIAQESGILQDPQEAAICLGCHAPAALTEAWERDPAFQIQDGIQCEDCHGPGSDYATKKIMQDRKQAMMHGLKMADDDFCMSCHLEKGSHTSVLGKATFDLQKAKKEIAHPTPNKFKTADLPSAPTQNHETLRHYVGSHACANCHQDASMGYQYSLWKDRPHARAFAVLATPKARKMAKAEGIHSDPQKSDECLRCHVTGFNSPSAVFGPTFSVDEGVGCEACHGPASDYLKDEKHKSNALGLVRLDPKACLSCHENAHGKPFLLSQALKNIAHPSVNKREAQTEREQYKTPLNMALSPNGREVYVACETSNSVIVLNVARREKVAEIQVGTNPADVVFHPKGRLAYVSNRHDDTVSVIDVRKRSVIRTVPVGDEPHGLMVDPSEKYLFVLNTASEDISVLEAESYVRIKTLSASRSPWSMSLDPLGSRIFVTNALSRFSKFRTPIVSEITVINTKDATIEERLEVPGANLMMGIDWHPSGEFALATLNRTKTLVPMTRLMQGWTITNGLAIIEKDGTVNQVLLDEPHLGFADATDVAFTPNGSMALVTSATTDRVAVIDTKRLRDLLNRATPEEKRRVLPNHLGTASNYLVKHIPTGTSPRGILVTRDGASAFVADALSDTITVIDLNTLNVGKTIDLGGSKEITEIRWGDQLFHSADITFHRQFACHSCHPDGHVDGLTYDIEPDGIGYDPVDNRTLRGILDTAPFKWTGKNPSLKRQCGPRLSVFFTRIQPFTPKQLKALDHYITTIPRPPNRYHPPGSEYTDAQRRGKMIFEREWTNDGRKIPKGNRCVTCHDPPYFTDRKLHDVGTQFELDKKGLFDTPHLNNIYDSAPYLHNGISPTLEEIWTEYNPDDKHGVTNDMTKDQLNDLMEYLKTL